MAISHLQIEKLTGRENYSTWRFAAKSYLEHEDLWECIDPGTNIDSKKDVKAKSKINLLVEPINFVHIENAKSAKEAWYNLQKAFEDSGLSRRVGLLRDLTNTPLDSCASVEDYVNKIMTAAYKLRNIGFEVGDDWLGAIMLTGLPEHYKPMIMGLESSGVKISADFIKTKLLQEVKISESSAFLTKKQNSTNSTKPKGKGPRCYNCNKYGHFKSQCKVKKGDQNNFSAVFSAYSTVTEDDWYIDSGATMHMTKRDAWMYDFQPPPISTIMVANNDVVSVQKMGKVNIQTYAAASGIKHQTSTPYTPEQNGLAERMNRTLVERAKCMLFEAKLHKHFWAEAVVTAAYIINRSPSRALNEGTETTSADAIPPNETLDAILSPSSADTSFDSCVTTTRTDDETYYPSTNEDSDSENSCTMNITLRTKHIDVRHHFVRDKVAEGLIDVKYMQTNMMVADSLTKALPQSKLEYCSSKMGLIYV
ncbi:hypothetical protein B5X24_HaOG201791 [Helicoverpa armigera]|nr:hypothetical protein B5X24_HaOG201791 [Helicoverpa armigera]